MKQILSNLFREDFSTFELSSIYQSLVNQGKTQQSIANAMGVDRQTVNKYIALLKMPDLVRELSENNKCKSFRNLYDIGKLMEIDAEKVETFVKSRDIIENNDVKELKAILSNKEDIQNSSNISNDTADDFKGYKTNQLNNEHDENSTDEESHDVNTEKVHSSKLSSIHDFRSDEKKNNREKIKNPLLLVEFENRLGAIQINMRPTKKGYLFIKYDDSGLVEEVNSLNCVIIELLDSDK